MIDLPTVTRVRALLLITAAALGLGMLVGNAQQGPLALGTVLQVLVGWSFVACGALPLGPPPGQPPRAADDDRRVPVAVRPDDDAGPESRRLHRGPLADRPLGASVRPVPAVVPDRPPDLSSRPRDRRHLPVRHGSARVPLASVPGARQWPERAGHRAQRERRPCHRHDPARPDLARFRAPRHRAGSALAAIQRPGSAPDGARPRGRRRDPPAVGVVDPLLVRDIARACWTT